MSRRWRWGATRSRTNELVEEDAGKHTSRLEQDFESRLALYYSVHGEFAFIYYLLLLTCYAMTRLFLLGALASVSYSRRSVPCRRARPTLTFTNPLLAQRPRYSISHSRHRRSFHILTQLVT
jgi:hypothetical protein